MTAYHGIDRSERGACKVMRNDDQELREKTAAEWTVAHNFNFTPDMINRTSCKGNGVQAVYSSSMCEIRALDYSFQRLYNIKNLI
ncbi:MAG: hypothetical protein LBI42_11140 [Chitinispirillales bacterium]|jgi:hypothetical protein|nr:hypothetical protein [Chitinispirillales bacterium]